ncbi:MAG TPA: YiiD C-terminal domain-containing protein [Ferrovibrio sp.]|jgi:thioesterase domain-containing protein|uniref:YiiD C-terminal domain-containing protein n=1 Tax=Ferrovibrio sp. TaxID=1917215 RepID=UPI002ED6A1CF
MTNDAAGQLEAYLHAHIPLSAAMQVAVVSAACDAVTLSAPLAPNLNHRNTAFGGSISALAILSAWSLINLRLNAKGLRSRLVIQSNRMDYDRPVPAAFTATASLADASAWPAFCKMLARKGRARIRAVSLIRSEGEAAGRFEGEFVAFRLDAAA